MQQAYEVNNVMLDLLEILYWKVFGMGDHENCERNHINKNEILALIEDVKQALEGK